MPFCRKCRFELKKTDQFCPKCGTPNSLSQSDKGNIIDGTQKVNAGSYGANEQGEKSTLKEAPGKYAVNPANLKPGFILDDRYEIRTKLGRGGFGTVYKAFDRNMDCIKAIKVIHSEFYDDKEVIADLKREAKLLMKLQSDKVVRLWDIHLSGDIKFIDMEYIDGGDLVDLKLLFPDKKVPEEKVKEIALQITDGMLQIHKHNIIHKDLKPQNIMFTKEGKVKLMDFGISETFRSSMSRIKETSRSGTPAYMSPEQLIGKDVGKESDIWSFGVMLYELLAGKLYFSGKTTSEVQNSIREKLDIEKDKATREFIQYSNVEPISDISNGTNKIISDCLQYNYRNRSNDLKKIKNDLKIIDYEYNKKKAIKLGIDATWFSKNYEEKLKLLTRAISLAPKYVDSYINRGDAYWKQDEYDKAISDYTIAIQLDPDNIRAFRGRGWAYKWKGEYDKAISDFTKVIFLEPIEPKETLLVGNSYADRGSAYEKKGDFEKAISDYTRAIQQKPNALIYLDGRGLIYHKKGEYKKAINDFDKAIKLSTKSTAPLNHRGLVYQEKGDYPKALKDFSKAIEINPKFETGYFYRGILYKIMGEYNKAIDDLSTFISEVPNYADTYLERGKVYNKTGEYNEALNDFTKAIELDSEIPETYLQRGLIYENKLHDNDAAFADYKKAFELNPDNKEYEEALNRVR